MSRNTAFFQAPPPKDDADRAARSELVSRSPKERRHARMNRPLPLLACLLSLSGCYDSFDALRRDAGSDAPLSDAALADAPGVDAPRADAPLACEAAVAWIDPVPATLPVSASVPLRLMANASGFELFFLSVNLDTPAPVLIRMPTRGAETLRAIAGWTDVAVPEALFLGTSSGGLPAYAARTDTALLWSLGGPEGEGMWVPSGSADLATTLPAGSVLADLLFVPDTARVYLASHASFVGPGPGPMARFDAFALQELIIDDTLPPARTISLPDPFGGFDHWDLTLAGSPEGEPMIAGVQDWDFPPAVQLGTIPQTFGTVGTSCGVDAYDVVATRGDVAGVLQGCGTSLALDVRTTVAPRRTATLASDRFALADSPVALVSDGGEGFVAAYWRGGDGVEGELAIVHVSSTLEVLSTTTVPGPTFFWAETFPGPVSLARHTDGTFAVAWSTSNLEGAIQRFTLCD